MFWHRMPNTDPNSSTMYPSNDGLPFLHSESQGTTVLVSQGGGARKAGGSGVVVVKVVFPTFLEKERVCVRAASELVSMQLSSDK